ncbi:MAG: hypothetical protein K0B52_02955, partial [FCB group bacterium]|nr:hypothetical protein [FCB group bacterium]
MNKISRSSVLLFLLLITLSCDPRVSEEDNVLIQVLGLFPSGSSAFTALAIKSEYLAGSYTYTDSLLFIHMDSSGNITGREALYQNQRPYVEHIFPIGDNKILVSGNAYQYYYERSFWELSLSGSILQETLMPQRATGMAPSADGNLFFFGRRSGSGESDDLFYVKVSTSGDTLWSKQFEISTSFNIHFGLGTQDNGCLALGTLWLPEKSNDIFAIRITENGDTLWTGTYGGDRWDNVNYALENPDGSLL